MLHAQGSPVTPAFNSAMTKSAIAAPALLHHPSPYAALSSMFNDPLEAIIPPTSPHISAKSILNTVVLQQQKRILELEKELQTSRLELSRMHLTLRASFPPAPPPPAPLVLPEVSAAAADAPPAPAPAALVGIAEKPPVAAVPAVAGGVKKKKKKSKKAKPEPEPGTTRYWLQSEHDMFLKGCQVFGPKNYTAISAMVKTRTPKQVRTHAQKYEKKVTRESIRKGLGPMYHDESMHSRSLLSDDTVDNTYPGLPAGAAALPLGVMPFDHLKKEEEEDLAVPVSDFDVLSTSLDDDPMDGYESDPDSTSPLSNQQLSCELGDDFEF